MKKYYLMGVFAFVFTLPIFSQSDNTQNNNPELTITKEGKLLEATVACLDAIEAPTKFNAYLKPFISDSNFPKKSSSISLKEYTNIISSYLQKNSHLIDEIRTEAKKANEKFYGPSSYYSN